MKKKIAKIIVITMVAFQCSFVGAQGTAGINITTPNPATFDISEEIPRPIPQKKTLTLPFLDNFIKTDSGNPVGNLWVHPGGVKVSNGYTKKNIDYNAAIFDGANAYGVPYDYDNPLQMGNTDSLVSQEIDLSQVAAKKDCTLYLTFYVQNGGYGEVNDGKEGDQFSLLFKDASDKWQQVWTRRDTIPNVTDSLILDKGFENFFKNIYKPKTYINTREDSVNYVKKVYPTLANFTYADQILRDSLDYFFTIWPDGALNGNPSSTDSINFYKRVYRFASSPETKYKDFFKNIYHKPENFTTTEDSLSYFKSMYPYELFPEDYYPLFFGKLQPPDGALRNLPVLYKDFSATAVKQRVDDTVQAYKNDPAVLAIKLAELSKDSINYFRSITTQSFVKGAYDEFTRYDYAFNKPQDSVFLHGKFQMSFVSHGRKSGSFDIWGLDYVYLRVKSNAYETSKTREQASITDPTISGQLPSVLAKYNSMPWKHFNPSTTALTDSVNITNQQLIRQLGSSLFSTVVFGYVEDGAVVNTVSRNFTTPNNYRDLASFDSLFAINKPTIDILKDTVIESVAYIIVPKDTNDPQVTDQNDILTKTTIMSNYYAYDDGEAERALEVSGRYSEMAYRFDLDPSVTSDNLSHVRIFFPKAIASNDNLSISLKIWKTISGPLEGRKKDVLLYVDTVVIKYSNEDKVTKFIEFKMDTTVSIDSSFYVGYELLSANSVYTGYDLNPTLNSSDKIFYNINGNWQQFKGEAGNLMIRPVFGPHIPEKKGTRTAEVESRDYFVYPNPSTGSEISVQGIMPVRLRLFDLVGNEHTGFNYDGDLGKINVSGLKSGIYTLKIIGTHSIVYKKIIIN